MEGEDESREQKSRGAVPQSCLPPLNTSIYWGSDIMAALLCLLLLAAAAERTAENSEHLLNSMKSLIQTKYKRIID